MSEPTIYLGGRVSVHAGDCITVMRQLPENSIDAICTDPPYGIGFMGKEWDSGKSFVERKAVKENVFDHVGGNHNPVDAKDAARTRGTEARKFGAWCEVWAREAIRCLKPGGHILAFGGTRTYHRLACAIEDAGFEIRDCLMWIYGTGFPKSHNVGKGIEKIEVGGKANLKIIGTRRGLNNEDGTSGFAYSKEYVPGVSIGGKQVNGEIPIYEINNEWGGWGTALKPAVEPVVLARKPLDCSTVAANVLKWGTGAINIGACRVATTDALGGGMVSMGRPKASEGWDRPWMHDTEVTERKKGESAAKVAQAEALGRWPANIVIDDSQEVRDAFPDASASPPVGSMGGGSNKHSIYGDFAGERHANGYGDSGSAARFFASFPNNHEIEQVTITWISDSEPCQATLLMDMGQLPGRATVALGSATSKEWSTFLSGKSITDLFRLASMCIIRTKTNSTITSPTWNWLISLLTNASIPVVNCGTDYGGSLAENAESTDPSLIIILEKTASLPGANHAASQTRLKISVSESRQQPEYAKRFWYSSKADADDRIGSSHPTIKPLALMQWLCKLVCPPGGTILDCFARTGTTGEAAWREGFNAVLCEREAEYLADIARRMKLCLAGPDERARESIKARNAGKPDDHGPLFGGTEYAGGAKYNGHQSKFYVGPIERSDQRGSNGEDR